LAEPPSTYLPFSELGGALGACAWNPAFFYPGGPASAVRREASLQTAPVPSRERRRSHAAVPVAFFLLLLGALLGHYTVLVPFLLGLLLFGSGASFLSSRLNPLSTSFYLTTKPSWSAIGAVFLSGMVLLLVAYEYLVRGFGPIVP
jgi:hypothetical protein